MSFGILKPARQFISKPFGGGFKLNRDHPLGKNLLLAIPLGNAGNREIEYVERIYSNIITGTDCPLVLNGARYWTDNNTSITTNMVRFVPRTSWVNLGTGPYTILSRVFSIKPGPIFSINSYNPNWFLSGAGEGPPSNSLMIYDGGYGAYSSSTVPLNQWSKIGWVRKSIAASDGFFYINGNLAGALNHTDTILSATSVQIGKNQPTADYHHHYGYIDFVYLWNRALSIHEINEFFNNPNQIFTNKKRIIVFSGAPFDGRSLLGNVQSQPATATGTIETVVSLSGSVQSQPATATGTITTSDVISLSGSVQSQPATATSTIETVVSLSGSVQSQPATATATIEAICSLSGNVQALPAQPLLYRILCIGQSNMAGWDSSLPKLSSDYDNTLMWKNTTDRWQQIVAPDATSGYPGTGSSIMHDLNDKLHELTGGVIGSLNTGYGGIGVVKGNSGQNGWSIPTSTPWVQMASRVASTGGAFDVVIHWGGESDVSQLVTREQFRDGLTALFNNLKVLLKNDLLYMFCVKTSCPDFDDVAVRQGYDDFAAQTNRVVLFEDAANYPVIDLYQHIAKENMALIGVKGAQAIYDWVIAKTENKLIGSVQSQPATASGIIQVIASISGSVQSQPATATGTIQITVSLSGNVQSQPATATGIIQTSDVTSLSGFGRNQRLSLSIGIGL